MSNQKEVKAKAVEEVVSMSDGRLVTFVGKRKMQKESGTDSEGNVVVRIDFRNGETRSFRIPDGLLKRFAAHGAEQKLGDETAGMDDLDDAVLAVDQLIERLNEGVWTMKSESSGLAGTSVLVRALVEHTGKTVEAIKAFLKDKTQAEKVALRSNPRIKPIIERIEAEKAAKATKIDTDALLEGLAA